MLMHAILFIFRTLRQCSRGALWGFSAAGYMVQCRARGSTTMWPGATGHMVSKQRDYPGHVLAVLGGLQDKCLKPWHISLVPIISIFSSKMEGVERQYSREDVCLENGWPRLNLWHHIVLIPARGDPWVWSPQIKMTKSEVTFNEKILITKTLLRRLTKHFRIVKTHT